MTTENIVALNKIPRPHVVTDEEHSEYSPSGSKRWVNCPASIKFLRTLPKIPERPNQYAEEGTAAHLLAAYCLENGIDPFSVVGKKSFNKHLVTKEMAKFVDVYIRYVNGAVTWDSTLWVENKIPLFVIRKDTFGTADAIIVSMTDLEVVDLKYGKGVVVEAEDNYQLYVYAIGVLIHLSKYGIKFPDEKEIKLTIVQPRAPHEKGPIRSDFVTVAQLRSFMAKVKEAITLSELDNPPFGPSLEVCRWCEASPVCKAYAEFNLKAAQLEFEDLVKTPLEFKQSLPSPNEMSTEQLSKVLMHSKSIQTWLNSCVEYAMNLLRANKPVPQYKLVYGRSIRKWSDPDAVIRTLLEYGTSEDRIYTKKVISPAKAEDELTAEELKKVIGFMVKPQGKVTLAPEFDKRPAIDPTKIAIETWSEEDTDDEEL